MKKDIVKTVTKEVIQTVDQETGEVIDMSVNRYKILINQDDFCLTYASFWNAIMKSKLSASHIDVLAYIIDNYSDGTPFNMSSGLREIIAEKSGKSESSYKNCTKALLDEKFIYRINNSRTYKLNPRYAFKGSSTNRKQAVIDMVSKCPDC